MVVFIFGCQIMIKFEVIIDGAEIEQCISFICDKISTSFNFCTFVSLFCRIYIDFLDLVLLLTASATVAYKSKRINCCFHWLIFRRYVI